MAATSNKSPKEWWSLLKDLKANTKWADPDQHASLEDLTSFFRSLYQDVSLGRDAQHNPDLTFSCSDYFRSNPPTQPVADDPMEQPLTPTEVSQVIKRLSLGKATGLDNISNEMLKLAGLIHLPFFTKLFNHIYSHPSGNKPTSPPFIRRDPSRTQLTTVLYLLLAAWVKYSLACSTTALWRL